MIFGQVALLALAGLVVGELAWRATRVLPPDPPAHPPTPLLAWATRLFTAGLFAIAGWRFADDPRLLFALPYIVVLVIILVIDLEHRLILDKVTFPAMGATLLASALPVKLGPDFRSAVLGGLVALVIFALLVAVAWRIHPDALGMGDLKLAVLIGLASGFPAVLTALLAGFVAGGIIAFTLLVLRLKRMKDTMPYGPSLVLGALYALFLLPGS